MHSSPFDYSCIMLKVKWAVNKSFIFGILLGVLDIDSDHRHVRAGGEIHNARYKGQYDALKERRAGESLCHLGKSNRKK